MQPIEPSSTTFTSIILTPFQFAFDLVRFVFLCVKCIFEGAYEFFLGSSDERVTTLVIDPNLVAMSQEEKARLSRQEKRQWDRTMEAVLDTNIRSQKEFDLIHMGRSISVHEQLQRKKILQIQGTDTNREARLYLTVRLPKSQLAYFPHDIRVRLKDFDQENELELYFVIYDMSQIGGKTFNFLYHPVACPDLSEDLHEKEIYTGVFHSEGLEPQMQRGVSFGQFSPSKLRVHKRRDEYETAAPDLCFKLDQPCGSFFTAAQFVSEQGHNQKGMGVFGIVVRDWGSAEARKISAAAGEKSLRGFLKKLQDSNFAYYHSLSSLFTYNENYYFTGV